MRINKTREQLADSCMGVPIKWLCNECGRLLCATDEPCQACIDYEPVCVRCDSTKLFDFDDGTTRADDKIYLGNDRVDEMKWSEGKVVIIKEVG